MCNRPNRLRIPYWIYWMLRRKSFRDTQLGCFIIPLRSPGVLTTQEERGHALGFEVARFISFVYCSEAQLATNLLHSLLFILVFFSSSSSLAAMPGESKGIRRKWRSDQGSQFERQTNSFLPRPTPVRYSGDTFSEN